MNKMYFDKDVKSVSAILERVLKIYETAGWITDDYAEDKNNVSCLSDDPEAVKFCLMSAIKATSNNNKLIDKAEETLLLEINKKFKCEEDKISCLMVWNDEYAESKRRVLNLVKRALKAL